MANVYMVQCYLGIINGTAFHCNMTSWLYA